MEILVLTTLFSVLFAVFFLLLFLRSRKNGGSCADHDALLPFNGEDTLADTESSNQPNLSKPVNTIKADAIKK